MRLAGVLFRSWVESQPMLAPLYTPGLGAESAGPSRGDDSPAPVTAPSARALPPMPSPSSPPPVPIRMDEREEGQGYRRNFLPVFTSGLSWIAKAKKTLKERAAKERCRRFPQGAPCRGGERNPPLKRPWVADGSLRSPGSIAPYDAGSVPKSVAASLPAASHQACSVFKWFPVQGPRSLEKCLK